MMSTNSPDPNFVHALEMLAAKVRDSSRCGNLVSLSQVWPGTEDQFLKNAHAGVGADIEDIVWIRESGRVYLYSKRHMTSFYAESVALVCSDDHRHLIAETVRRDSRTYPRPTPAAIFCEFPFGLPQDALDQALEEITADPNYADILRLRASDGSLFLYSTTYLDPGQAELQAEWMAVGHQQNP